MSERIEETTSNGQLNISPVANKAQMQAFLRLPWAIQRHDPNWVPPVISLQKKMLDPRKGHFFRHGKAAYFLACRNGVPVGRLSAHVNGQYEKRYDSHTGFFGFFECHQDPEAACRLLDAARSWLRQRGKSRILGPLSFSIYDEVGCLVEGFEHLPAIMHVHNPPYYAELLAGCGLQKAVDWHALRITDSTPDIGAMQQGLEAIMTKQKVRMAILPPKEAVVRRREEVRQLFNQTWDNNWMHIPFSREQFDEVINELKPLLRTDFMRFILDEDERIVAFIITVPDINPAIQKLNGRLTPWGLANLYFHARARPLTRMRTILMGVERAYQRRMLHHALILSTYIQILKTPSISVCDLSLIAETNTPLLRQLGRYNAEKYKTWRIFEGDTEQLAAQEEGGAQTTA